MLEFLKAFPEWEEYKTANGTGTGAVWPKDPANTGAVVFGRVTETWQARVLDPTLYPAAKRAHWWQSIEIEGWPNIKAFRPYQETK